MGAARQLAVANENRSIDQSVERAAQAVRPRRMTALESMAERLNVSTGSLQTTLINTAFKNCSEAEFVALVIVSNLYDLNPLLREIYAFPKKGGGIQAIVGYDGWIKIAERHPQYDGIEFEHTEDDMGKIKMVEGILHRKDRNHPTKKMVYLDEFKMNTPPWNEKPRHMLDVRCFCQTVRLGLGISLGVEGVDDGGGANYTNAPVQALPSAQSLAEELDDGIPDFDKSTGEVRDERGMSEVDEDTARELDAGQGEEEVEQDETDRPAWHDKVQAIRAGFANAKKVGDLKPHATAFDNIRVGLPDDVIEELDGALAARRKVLAGEGGQ